MCELVSTLGLDTEGNVTLIRMKCGEMGRNRDKQSIFMILEHSISVAPGGRSYT